MPTVANLGRTQLDMAQLEEVGLLVQHLQYRGPSRVLYNSDVPVVVRQHTHQWQVENMLTRGPCIAENKFLGADSWLLIGGSVAAGFQLFKPRCEI